MKLIDILDIVHESNTISIYSSYDEGSFLLGWYDNKNNVDEFLNDKRVVEILADGKELIITIIAEEN